MASKRSAADMEEPCGQASSSSGDRPMTRDDVEHLIRKEVKKALTEAMEAARQTTRIEVVFDPKCEDPELEEIGHKLVGDEGKRIIQERAYCPLATSSKWLFRRRNVAKRHSRTPLQWQ